MTGKYEKGILFGVGVGPGDPELITVKALRILAYCDVVGIPGKEPSQSVAYRIAAAAYPEICGKEKLMLETPMTKDYNLLNRNYDELASRAEEELNRGKNVAILTLGDPTIYSTCIYIIRRAAAHGYRTQLVSGVPSFCAVAAKLGDSLADRDTQIHIIPASYGTEEALALPGTKILMKAGKTIHEAKCAVLEGGFEASLAVNCGMPGEQIYEDAADAPDDAGYYSMLIVR